METHCVALLDIPYTIRAPACSLCSDTGASACNIQHRPYNKARVPPTPYTHPGTLVSISSKSLEAHPVDRDEQIFYDGVYQLTEFSYCFAFWIPLRFRPGAIVSGRGGTSSSTLWLSRSGGSIRSKSLSTSMGMSWRWSCLSSCCCCGSAGATETWDVLTRGVPILDRPKVRVFAGRTLWS